MSNSPIISVSGLGKKYRLYDRPQDRLKEILLSPFGKQYGREFWALQNVSFEVQPGETLGIIGRNGSGKSTLLQILTNILTPTVGEVQVNGRVAALLELGSGFNPEFTGRENVYLNGAILGISRDQMEERFAQVAEFADIGDFMDQPVKLYSSGMFVRLAFSVAVNVDADILVIDEVLAVGDVFFRQKCYRKLEEMRARGVTVLLVSHAMTEVEQLCDRALLLDRGEVIFEGRATEAVERYYLIEQNARMASLMTERSPSAAPPPVENTAQDGFFWPDDEAFIDISEAPQVSNGWAHCRRVALCNSQGQPCRVFEQGETASFFYEIDVLRDIEVPFGGIVLQNDKGIVVHGKGSLEHGTDVPQFVPRGSRLRFRQDIDLELAVGEYTFEIGFGMMSSHDYKHRAVFPHSMLETKMFRLCVVPDVGQFAVVFRTAGKPVQLLHHGIANLPGECRVNMITPEPVPDGQQMSPNTEQRGD